MRRWLELAQIRLEGTVARWNNSLRRFSVLAVVLDAADAFARDNMSFLAAALSYYTLLSLFPLLLLLISIAAFFIAEESALETVVQTARTFIPGAENELRAILHQVVELRGGATVFGIVALVWSASSVFDVLQHALDRAWRVREARAFWLQRLFSIVVVILLGALFFLSVLTTVFSQEVVYNLLGVFTLAREVIRLVSALIGFLFAFVGFSILYKTFPHVRVAWSVAVRGAFVAALLWQCAKFLYEVYVNSFARLNLVYGSVGAIIGLMLWGYIAATTILFGAELAAALGRKREGEKE